MRFFAPLILALSLFVSPRIAQAQEDGVETFVQILEGWFLVSTVLVGSTAAGTVALAGYTTYDAIGGEASEDLRLAGYVLGGAWAFTGSMILAFADDDGLAKSDEQLLGGAMLGIGGFALSSAVLSHVMAEPPPLVLAPSIHADKNGTLSGGASITFAF
jgi:hypothetical protein